MPEFQLNFNYESEYGSPPPTATGTVNNWPYFIVPASMLPTMTSDEATFLGWSYNGGIVSAGDTITLGDGTPTFVAVWQKPTTYVIVEKDDLITLADIVRSSTGETGKFNATELISEAGSVIENGGSGGATEASYDCEVDFNVLGGIAYSFDAYDSSASAPMYGFTFPFSLGQFRESYNNTLFKRKSLFYFTSSATYNVETTGDIEIIEEGGANFPIVLKINGNGTIIFTT